MSELHTARDTILADSNPVSLLRLADNYLRAIERMGDDFVLPRTHVAMKPVLDFYAGDLHGFIKFVRHIRDRLPSGTADRSRVQELFRTLTIRAVQQVRRIRLNAAFDMAVQKGIVGSDYQSRLRYQKCCTQFWAMRRKNLLDVLRRESSIGRLSVDARYDHLCEFWDQIGAEITNGELPAG